MTSNADIYESIRQSFFADGYRMAKEQLGEKAKKNGFLSLQKQVYAYYDEFEKLFILQTQQGNVPIHCKKGCSYCCSNAVMILPQEAMYIVEKLKEEGRCEELEMFRKKAQAKNETTKDKKADEFLFLKIPCPFLVEGSCSVYENRPMACRLFLSQSVASCKTEYENPRDISVFPQLFDLPLIAGRALNHGVCTYLSEIGLVPFEWLLESSVLVASDKDKSARWLDGDDPFQVRDIGSEELAYIEDFGKRVG